MPRLRFKDPALVLRLVEAAITSGKPLMLAHDHGVYLCHDDVKHPAPGTGCICAFVDGMEPEVDPDAFETANAFVGFDDFGERIPLTARDQPLLDDLKRGHELVIGFSATRLTINTLAPRAKRPPPTPTAHGRGTESQPAARTRNGTMSTTKTKSSKKTKSGASKKSERLAKEARKEIAERIATLDGAKVKSVKPGKPSKGTKPAKAKRVSALDAAATVLHGAKEPMNSADLIKAMAERKLWSSPSGKTPGQTLYAALIREIKAKGKDARFTKTDRGLFASNRKAG